MSTECVGAFLGPVDQWWVHLANEPMVLQIVFVVLVVCKLIYYEKFYGQAIKACHDSSWEPGFSLIL